MTANPIPLHPHARLLPPDLVAEPEPKLLALVRLSTGLTDDEVETAWQMSRAGFDELEALRLVRAARTPCPEPLVRRACAIPLERKGICPCGHSVEGEHSTEEQIGLGYPAGCMAVVVDSPDPRFIEFCDCPPMPWLRVVEHGASPAAHPTTAERQGAEA
jgi:hypothetical protein